MASKKKASRRLIDTINPVDLGILLRQSCNERAGGPEPVLAGLRGVQTGTAALEAVCEDLLEKLRAEVSE